MQTEYEVVTGKKRSLFPCALAAIVAASAVDAVAIIVAVRLTSVLLFSALCHLSYIFIAL